MALIGKRGWRRAGIAFAACAIAVGSWQAWDRLRPLPEPTPGDAARGAVEFISSDLGSARYTSIPRIAIDAMPELFPELLPEGWEGVGIFWDGDDHDRPPVGTVAGTFLGLESISLNCALCHAGKFNGKVVAGLPNDLDLDAAGHVFYLALKSGRLTADALADFAKKKGRPLSTLQKWTLARLVALAQADVASRPDDGFRDELGPGRSNALGDWKHVLGVHDGHDIGWVDLPAIFNQRLKKRTLYDGSITGDMSARVMLTELRKGRPARDALLHREVFDDLVAWMDVLTPPPYPFAVDHDRAARGRAIFEDTCSSCHGSYGEHATYPNKRIDVSRVGTDPERARAMTTGMVEALNHHAFKDWLTIEPREAYMPPALDGVYMTAPYLHNGSVPTLWHLLQPPEKRPVAFYRRWNEFDPKRVGLACDEVTRDGALECAPDATQRKHAASTVWRFDTTKTGNRNTGHVFGTDLSDDEKSALIEYLKTI